MKQKYFVPTWRHDGWEIEIKGATTPRHGYFLTFARAKSALLRQLRFEVRELQKDIKRIEKQRGVAD